MKLYYHSGKMPTLIKPVGVVTAFDRTRILFDVPEIEPVIAIGEMVAPASFADVCDERASQISEFAKAQDQKLYVLWSGGIDSTAALVALMKFASASDIVVVMSEGSIAEYPWFYENKINGKLAVEMTPQATILPRVSKLIRDGRILVTGELGDQIFGSVKYKDYPDYSVLMSPWQDVLSAPSEIMERYERFAAACPAQIKTTKEFWWWLSYAVKYQGVCFRTLLCSRQAVLERNVFHFFHAKSFNDWAVSTPMEEKFFGTDERRYKQIAKDYIFDTTGDLHYRNEKTKEVSLQPKITPVGFHTFFTWVATDWSKG